MTKLIYARQSNGILVKPDMEGQGFFTVSTAFGSDFDSQLRDDIVSRFNSHAALVEALKRCLPIVGAYLQDQHRENHSVGVESYAECTHSPCVLIRSIRDKARAALTLAKGGK